MHAYTRLGLTYPPLLQLDQRSRAHLNNLNRTRFHRILTDPEAVQPTNGGSPQGNKTKGGDHTQGSGIK